ncbi:uncharacterized protein I206_100025 [Kwoniella pini CBS 10737]|uniref:Uncharacterized protein n=1 Tax=Kwoniella pini CBS 10737 TaxID=1296096 RepID=A0A1B9HSB1_9TREE|nr:uncharacterized protein I206_07840 [Kwoniella pini CBS 10737]OCF46170.1 hypothetical protein I206_07840 [Kwoniella pini CBS 10737]
MSSEGNEGSLKFTGDGDDTLIEFRDGEKFRLSLHMPEREKDDEWQDWTSYHEESRRSWASTIIDINTGVKECSTIDPESAKELLKAAYRDNVFQNFCAQNFYAISPYDGLYQTLLEYGVQTYCSSLKDDPLYLKYSESRAQRTYNSVLTVDKAIDRWKQWEEKKSEK